MRRPLVAANWKMHRAPEGAFDAHGAYASHDACDVVVFPCALDVAQAIAAGLSTGAQHAAILPEETGAFTGDLSMKLLRAAGCTWVLCGHSERRLHHGETDSDVAAQVHAALEAGLHPIVCVGETDAQRRAGQTKEVLQAQTALLPLTGGLTLAYEPVWAIGTGVSATPALAQEMHAFLRSLLPSGAAESVRILYGGSVTAENAADLLAEADIDGALVGSASLDPVAFAAIVDCAGRRAEK